MTLTPTSEAELAEAVSAAKGPLAIAGGGTRQGLGHAVEGDRLETSGLSGVTLYEPGALTLVVQAGTPMAEVDAALAAEGQRLPFEPMDHRPLFGTNGVPTIGGVVATGAAGPRRIQAGGCRDSLIGVRFVNGKAEVVKNGGRVMKNVTGYDLVKLMAGSHGTLGVLTEVSFKVLPAAESTALITLVGLSPDVAVQAMSRALGSPYDVSGAAHLVKGRTEDGGMPSTLIRVEGLEGSVRYRADRLQAELAEFGEVITQFDAEKNADIWAYVRDARSVADGAGDVWRVSVRPTDGPAVLDAAGPGVPAQMDWGGGLIWLRLPAGTDLRARLGTLSGHATLVRAAEDTKTELGVFQPEPAALAAISTGLRRKFDPRGVLNPGRMGVET